MDLETQRAIAETLTLANQLGATVYTLKGEDVVQAILQFAGEHRVGQIVIGSPRELSYWRRLILGQKTMAEKILLASPRTTIVIVPAPEL